jgi:hypothetical protein
LSAALNLPCICAATAARPVHSAAGVRKNPITPVAFYRKHTEALLRRYMHLSMEMGRTPSLLGNFVFRGRMSSYRVRSFEDAVIFVFDVEKCLKRLEPYSQQLIARIALQEYTQGEAAELMGQSIRTIVRRYADALDALTTIFLEVDLLSVPPPHGCQAEE